MNEKLRRKLLWGLSIYLVILFVTFPILTSISKGIKRSVWNTLLESTNIQTIEFDKGGLAWMGTGEGIIIFNGETFQIFNEENSDLANNIVNAIAFDKDNRAWIGTDDGISVYDGKMWLTYKSLRYITEIVFDHFGQTWIGTKSNGVSVFDGEKWKTYKTEPLNQPITDIAVDNKNRVWIGTLNGGIVIFDGKSWITLNRSNSSLISDQIETISFDEYGVALIGTYAGVSKYDGSTWVNVSDWGFHYHFYGKHILFDKNLWIGSNLSTVAVYDGKDWTIFYPSDSGLTDYSTIQTIAIHPNNNIWFGTTGGVAILNLNEVSSTPKLLDWALNNIYFSGWLYVWPILIGLLFLNVYFNNARIIKSMVVGILSFTVVVIPLTGVLYYLGFVVESIGSTLLLSVPVAVIISLVIGLMYFKRRN
jgi:ligand-binding sensor domain-containing protein